MKSWCGWCSTKSFDFEGKSFKIMKRFLYDSDLCGGLLSLCEIPSFCLQFANFYEKADAENVEFGGN